MLSHPPLLFCNLTINIYIIFLLFSNNARNRIKSWRVMRKHHNFRVPWNMHSTHINYGIIYAGGRVFSLLLLTFICFARHYDIIFNSIIAANVSHITIRSQVGSCVLAEFSSVSLHYCRIANSTN